MLFWVLAAMIALLTLTLIVRPLLSGRGSSAARAAYDVQIYRDQLAELETDIARGVLNEGDAEASRAEISRRLLAAGEAAEHEAIAGTAPVGLSKAVTAGVALATVGLTLVTYFLIGAPGTTDQPLAQRTADIAVATANRPSQEEAEAQIAASLPGPLPEVEGPAADEWRAAIVQLEQALQSRPDDATGYRLLANAYMEVGRVPDARAAMDRVMAILGGAAGARDFAQHAEFQIIAAGGYVSPQAERSVAQALQLDPGDPIMRYYSGLALAQNGESELALRIWAALLEEGPEGAPWITAIEQDIGQLASQVTMERLARGQSDGGLPPLTLPGPTAEDVEAASELTTEEQSDMVRSMVSRLSDRLASEGGTPEEWARLIRALGVLGETDRARAILAEARTVFAESPEGLAAIEAAAVGLP